MGAKEARKHDDGMDDPDNPVVPFRMSDRIEMFRIRWLLYAAVLLSATSNPFVAHVFGQAMASFP